MSLVVTSKARMKPREQRLVVRVGHDLDLKPKKSSSPLSVEHGHVDGENTHKAVCDAFFSSCSPATHPRHAFGDARRFEW